MNNLSEILPLIIIVLLMLFFILGNLMLLKKYDKKPSLGEVIVLNTLDANPEIVRNGAFVMPYIHKASIIDLNTQIIAIESTLLDQINDRYGVKLNNISVQI